MTQKDIENLAEGQTLYDKGSPFSVPGLHVRAFKTKKVFYCHVSVRGRASRPKIGDTRIFTLEQARKIAKQLRAGAVLGVDYISLADEKADEKTVAEVWKSAWDEHWNTERFKKSRHAAEVKGNFKRNIEPSFGDHKLSEVTVAAIEIWMRGFGDKIYAANRSLEVLSSLYDFAERKQWRAQNTNPCRLVKAFSETRRKRFARPEEIRRVGEILKSREATHPAQVAFIYLLIFTGSRPSAIERATFNDVEVLSGGHGAITIDGKTGRDRIHLPPQAMRVIDKLPRDRATITGIKMPHYFWKQVRTEAGAPDLWARDWRRTFATVLMSEGEPMPVISELLNHKSLATTKIYAHVDDEKRKTLAEKAGGRLEELLGGGV